MPSASLQHELGLSVKTVPPIEHADRLRQSGLEITHCPQSIQSLAQEESVPGSILISLKT